MFLLSTHKLAIVCPLATFFMMQTAAASINTRITASRVSGVAPLAVFFDASGTTSTSTSIPFHEVHYKWNFDDPTAGNWRYGNTKTKKKNIEYGPEIAHVFDKPGVYKVKLNTKTLNGDTGSRIVNITVSNPNTIFSGTKTICYSNDSNFSGCPSGARRRTTNSFSTLLADIGSGKRMLLKAGDRFIAPDRITIQSQGPGIISSFGSGAKPVIDHVDNDEEGMFIVRENIKQWTIRGLNFVNSTDAKQGDILEIEGGTKDILFYQNSKGTKKFARALFANNSIFRNRNKPLPDKIFFIDNDMVHHNHYVIFAASKRLAIMGNHMEDTATHVNRLTHVEKGAVMHNHYEHALANTGLLTVRSENKNVSCNYCGNDTHSIVFSDNYFIGNTDGLMGAVSVNNGGDVAHGHDFIYERNFYSQSVDSPNEAQTAIGIRNADHSTIRNNILLMKDWKGYKSVSVRNDVTKTWFYNNSCYSPNNHRSSIRCINVEGAEDTPVASNNVLYAPNNLPISNTKVVDGTHSGGANIEPRENPYASSNIAGPEDFALSSRSAAASRGIRVPVFIDYTGAKRNINGSFDIGAIGVGGAGGDGGNVVMGPIISLLLFEPES